MPTVAETIRKVNEFADLPNGWHFGEGVPPSEGTREQAVRFLNVARWLLGIERANAFPGVNGQVQVTFYREEGMLELTIEADNSITVAEDIGDKQVFFKEDVPRADAYDKLREFSQNIWPSLESFTENITIQNVRTSPVRLWIYTVASPSPWLGANVPSIRAGRFASTLLNFTASNQGSLLYTGAFPTSLFHQGVGSGSKGVSREMIAITISTVGQEDEREMSLSH